MVPRPAAPATPSYGATRGHVVAAGTRIASLARPDLPEAADPAPYVRQFPTLHVSDHPAVIHKLALLRDERTEPKKFRELVREISWLVGYEALADARLDVVRVRTPLEMTDGTHWPTASA